MTNRFSLHDVVANTASILPEVAPKAIKIVVVVFNLDFFFGNETFVAHL